MRTTRNPSWLALSPLLLALTACGGYDLDDRANSSTASGTWTELADDEEPVEMGCDEDAPVVLYASPDDSNSMSSPMQAMAQVLAGDAPYNPIRTYEFFNYATWDYPAADAGQLLVDLQLAEATDANTFSLQVGISSERIEPTERAPMVLTFSVDQSGSMSGTPIRRMKDSLKVIATQLRPGDIVSIVGWSDGQDVLLDGHTIAAPNDPLFLQAIDRISTSGGTDLAGGLRAAYRITEENRIQGRIHRVVLMSDGGANIGITDAELIGDKAGANDTDGIYMVGIGTGETSYYNDLLMDQVTDLGRGAAVFIATQEQAEEVFGDRFLETMAATARDVRIRYDLPSGFAIDRFSGEELSTDPSQVQPQHMAPNDAVVLFQQLSVCSEAVDLDQAITVTVSYLDGVTFEPREASATATLRELLDGDHAQLLKGKAIYTFAETLKHERGEEADSRRGEAREALDAALDANPDDADLAQIRLGLDALGL